MISRLFNSDAVDFSHGIGLGFLSDQLEANVSEELNGQFIFKFSYPIDGVLYSKIREGMIVTAKTPKPSYSGKREQPFRIKKISKPLNGIVEIYAEHISYDLSGIPINPMKGGTHRLFTEFAEEIYSKNPLGDNRFRFLGLARSETAAAFTNETPKSVRALIGGEENSLMTFIKTELMWDEWDVIANERRGTYTDYVIRYGVDLIDLLAEYDITEVLSHLYPFFAIDTSSVEDYDAEKEYTFGDYAFYAGYLYAFLGSGGMPGVAPSGKNSGNGYWTFIGLRDPETNLTTVTLPETLYKIPDSILGVGYNAQTVEMSDYLNGALPTVETLREVTESYVNSHTLGNSMPSIKIDFVPLWDTDEYKTLPIDVLELGDDVRCYCPKLTGLLSARIVSYKYDTLRERYAEIELGRIQKTVADSIIGRKEIYMALTTGGLSANRRVSKEFAEQAANIAMTYYRNRNGEDAQGNPEHAFEYNANKNWLVYSADDPFDGNEDKGIDCSSFIGLVLRGIDFWKSPYKLSQQIAARVTPSGEDDDDDPADDDDSDDRGGDGEGIGNFDFSETAANTLEYHWAINPYDYTYPLEIIGPKTTNPNNMTPVRRASQLGNWMADSGWSIYWDRTFAQVEVGDIVYWAKHNADGNWRQPNRYMHISHIAICTGKRFVEDYDSTFTYLLGNYAFITRAQLVAAFGEDTEYKEGLYRCIAETSTGSVADRIGNFEYIGHHRYRHAMIEATGTEGTPSNVILNRTLERTNPNDVCLICRPDLGALAPAENAGNIANELPEYTIPGSAGVHKDINHLYKDGFYYLTQPINIGIPTDVANTGAYAGTGTGLDLLVRSTYRGNGQKYSILQMLIDSQHDNDIWVRTKYLFRQINGETVMYEPDDVAWTSWQRYINQNFIHIMANANGMTEPTMSGGHWVCADGGAKKAVQLPASSVPNGYIATANGSGGATWQPPQTFSQQNADWLADSGVAKILNKPDLFAGMTEVPDYSDLNDSQFWAPGSYYVPSGTVAGHTANYPLPVGGLLITLAIGPSSSQWKRQIVIGRNTDLKVFMRYNNGSTITHWFTFTPTDHGS